MENSILELETLAFTALKCDWCNLPCRTHAPALSVILLHVANGSINLVFFSHCTQLYAMLYTMPRETVVSSVGVDSKVFSLHAIGFSPWLSYTTHTHMHTSPVALHLPASLLLLEAWNPNGIFLWAGPGPCHDVIGHYLLWRFALFSLQNKRILRASPVLY